jgi:hypothetical protein
MGFKKIIIKFGRRRKMKQSLKQSASCNGWRTLTKTYMRWRKQNVTAHQLQSLTDLNKKPKLTNPMEVQDAIRGLKVGKAPGPNGLPNRALKHLPQRAICLLVALSNTALLAQYFPTVWKHARVISILKPRKDPSLPSSYHPINLLHTIGKLSENIPLSRILSEVSWRGLLRDKQLGFSLEHTVWQLYNATDFILTKTEVSSMKQRIPSMCPTFICNLATPQRSTLGMAGHTAPCCAGSERTWSQ